jgi:hypothetical protein
MDPQDLEPLTPYHFLREVFQIPIEEDKPLQETISASQVPS